MFLQPSLICLPPNSILEHLQLSFFPQCEKTSSLPMKSKGITGKIIAVHIGMSCCVQQKGGQMFCTAY